MMVTSSALLIGIMKWKENFSFFSKSLWHLILQFYWKSVYVLPNNLTKLHLQRAFFPMYNKHWIYKIKDLINIVIFRNPNPIYFINAELRIQYFTYVLHHTVSFCFVKNTNNSIFLEQSEYKITCIYITDWITKEFNLKKRRIISYNLTSIHKVISVSLILN